MATTRRAEVTWEGDLMSGRGTVSAKSSGLFDKAPVTWASRTENPDGRTSPEELLAAAHASCFSMALSHALAQAKTPAERLEVRATVTFDKVGSGFKVTASALEVAGWVKGLDSAGFEKAAAGAKDGCPISQALKGNVELSVKATLAKS
jgi:osmotically inducible protein OsmC